MGRGQWGRGNLTLLTLHKNSEVKYTNITTVPMKRTRITTDSARSCVFVCFLFWSSDLSYNFYVSSFLPSFDFAFELFLPKFHNIRSINKTSHYFTHAHVLGTHTHRIGNRVMMQMSISERWGKVNVDHDDDDWEGFRGSSSVRLGSFVNK